MIKTGDAVQVAVIEREGALVRTSWYLAIVQETWPHKFTARLRKGGQLLQLSMADKERTWK